MRAPRSGIEAKNQKKSPSPRRLKVFEKCQVRFGARSVCAPKTTDFEPPTQPMCRELWMVIMQRRLRDRASRVPTRVASRPAPHLDEAHDGLTRERGGSMPHARGGARGSRLCAFKAPRGGRPSATRRVAALRRGLRRPAIGLGSSKVRRERRVRRQTRRVGPVRARLRRGGHHAVAAHARPRGGRRGHGRRHVAAGVRPPRQRRLRQEHRAGDRAVATGPRAPQDGVLRRRVARGVRARRRGRQERGARADGRATGARCARPGNAICGDVRGVNLRAARPSVARRARARHDRAKRPRDLRTRRARPE